MAVDWNDYTLNARPPNLPSSTKGVAGAEAPVQSVSDPGAGAGLAVMSIAPPAPQLVSRSESSITVQPKRWFPSPIPHKHKHRPGDHNKPIPPPTVPTVAYLRLFGKTAGAGTDVTLNNLELPGSGIPVEYDEQSGCAKAVTVTGLIPNEAYVFAVAAYDHSGQVLCVKNCAVLHTTPRVRVRLRVSTPTRMGRAQPAPP